MERIYRDVKSMASRFEFKPSEKLNEAVMAKRFGASRTPLREALNRLVSEGFLTFEKGRGFFCRSLTAGEILDLYQARDALECKTVELACKSAGKSDLLKLQKFLIDCEPHYHENTAAEELVALDEEFHMGIAKLSGNAEILRMLDNLNARMRYVRTIDLEKRRVVTPLSHREILDAIITNDVPLACGKMHKHIVRSSEEATVAVRQAYAQIYVPE